MSKLTFTKPRATLEEILALANVVREAGGGNPLDALMPAIPRDARQCLIAKNLNFNCLVRGTNPALHSPMAMYVDSRELRDRIADATGFPIYTGIAAHETFAVLLPPEVTQVARDFDAFNSGVVEMCGFPPRLRAFAADAERERLRTFWPYIDASIRETYANADFVNAKGEIII